jgi:lysine-N-methylase
MAILHRTVKLSALMPRYTQRFRCTGSACEDTCCVGWSVQIDKKTFKAYRGQSHPEIQPVVALIRRIDNPVNDSKFAVLPLGETGYCPAQKDGMCTVHATLGESYLSDTCQNYPRINRHVNGQPEQSLSLSCSEAARLALLDEDAFEFLEAPVDVREGTLATTDTGDAQGAALINEIRIFCMNLMRTRELPLWQRMALLGVLCDAIERNRLAGAPVAVPAIIDEMVRAIENGALTTALEQIQPDHDAQAQVFATLWGIKVFTASTAFQGALSQRIATGLGADANGQVGAAGLAVAYQRGLARLDQTLADVPWFLENYLLNEIFSQLFPFEGGNTYNAYLRLVARFGLVRLLLAAQCNVEDGRPLLPTLVSTVALQCRRFQHDATFTENVNHSLRASEWSELAKLHTLIRA